MALLDRPPIDRSSGFDRRSRSTSEGSRSGCSTTMIGWSSSTGSRSRWRRREASADAYAAGHLSPGDVLLVIEVDDTSLEHDQAVTSVVYAVAGIPAYWPVNLPQQTITVYHEPTNGGYRPKRHGESLTRFAFPDVSFAVHEILGPAPAGV